MFHIDESAVRTIGWTLLHFLWQGAAIAALFAVASWLLRERSADARYVAGCAALLLMAAAPVATCWYLHEPAAAQPAAFRVASGVAHPDGAVSAPQPTPPAIADTTPPVPSSAAAVAIAAVPPPATPQVAQRVPEVTWQQRLDPALPWCVAVWVGGVLVLSARLFGGWLQLQRIRRHETRPAPAMWSGRLASLAQRVGVRRAVRLLECASVECPAVVGWIRPVILLPASAMSGLLVAQLESILAHELAHVRRHDYLVNLMQSAIETLLFYHPAVWWVSNRVRQERENAGDDVAAGLHGDRVTYAEALATLEALRGPSSSLALAAGGGAILPRIRRLLGRPAADTGRSAWWPLAALVAVVVAIVVTLRTVPTTAADRTSPPDGQARIEEHLQTLRTMRVFTNNEGWVAAMRALAEIGKPAVPALLKELETSDRAHTQAAIALTLRAIGDRRAVPGLIHALARCRVHVSDYGINVEDPALRLWLQSHQKDGGDGDLSSVSFGRPVNEITKSLVQLTGHTEHLAHVITFDYDDDDTLDARREHGSERERRILARVADRYRAWWDANRASLLTPDEAAWLDAHAPREHALAANDAPRRLDVTVVGPDTQPVAAADVEAWVERDRYALRTDDAGRVAVPLPAAAPKRVTVVARKGGLTPVMAWWVDEKSPAPTAHTLKLRAGGEAGGIVRDGAGAPVRGATVFLSVPHRFDDVERAAIVEEVAVTDPAGRFRFDNVPPEATKVLVRVVADGYVPDAYYGERKPQPKLEQLRAGSAELTIARLRDVSGIVRGPDGQPLGGATVGATGSKPWRDPPFSARSQSDGRFTITGLRPGKLTVTATAPGMTPATTQPTAGDAQVELRLNPARTVRGRVTDATTGQPLDGAFVHALAPFPAAPLQTQSGADGSFEWVDAPRNEVAVVVEKVGYNAAVLNVPSDQSETTTVALQRALTIVGRIVDAGTGEPIPAATVMPGVKWNEEMHLHRSLPRTATDGRYEFAFPVSPGDRGETPRPRFVRIEADGYAPVTSRLFQPDEGHQVFDARMTRGGGGTTGVAVAPDGTPAAGAEVIIATALQEAEIYNGRNHDVIAEQNQAVRADDAGRFTVPPTGEPFVVAIAHERGFATASEADLKGGPSVELQPWGRVEGVLIKDGKPLVEKGVSLWVSPYRAPKPGKPNVKHQFHGHTDLQGRFTFDRVPAGTYRVGSQVPLNTTVSTSSPGVPVRVARGETVHVQLGGEGSRSVVGKLALPAAVADEPFDWSTTQVTLFVAGAGEGAAATTTQPATTARTAQPQPDGTFRFDAVPAGSYEVTDNFSLPPRAQDGQERVRIGALRAQFEVPGGADDAPIDIGRVSGSVRSPLGVGNVAPPVRAKTLDDKPLNLADHKGKFVLVDFWATWCGPCVGETPHLKAVWERFRNDPRFAMIGLSLDDDAAAPKEYARKNELGWTQGFLGAWSKTRVPSDWGVDGIPAIFLVGPDGKIVAKDLRGTAIADAIAAALRPDQSSPATQPAR